MSEISRFGVSAEEELLKSYDRLLADQGYANRSEALRDLMRDALVKSRLETYPENSEVLGSLTLVYDHHATDLNDKMNQLQHDHHELVVSVLHVHVSYDDCMEVIVLRGALREIRFLAEGILSLRGVKHGHLFITLASEQMISEKVTAKKHSAKKHSHDHNGRGHSHK